MYTPDWRKFLERTGFVLFSLVLILLGLIQGFQTYSIQFDLFFVIFNVLFVEAALSSLFFTVFIGLSGLLFFWRLRRSETPDLNQERSICCIIPTYQDSEALHNSVESLLESNYSDFEVLIVCEEDDEKGIETAEKFAEREKVDFLVNTRYPNSKAGAINFASEETDSDLIAIFDADQKVEPAFLGNAAALSQENDVVQGRFIPRPNGFIESMAYYESLIFSYVIRQFLNLVTGFRLVGSRATVIRRDVFKEIGGYSTDTLTEDYEFAHECYRQNLRVREIFLSPVNEEAAHSLMDWWGQRKRWMIGYLQVFLDSIRHSIRNYSGYRDIISMIICGGSILGSFFMLTLVSKFVILLFLGANLVYTVPLATVLIIALAGRVHDYRKGHVCSIGFSWTLTPLIFPLFSLITVKGFFEFLLEKDKSWYRVEKG